MRNCILLRRYAVLKKNLHSVMMRGCYFFIGDYICLFKKDGIVKSQSLMQKNQANPGFFCIRLQLSTFHCVSYTEEYFLLRWHEVHDCRFFYCVRIFWLSVFILLNFYAFQVREDFHACLEEVILRSVCSDDVWKASRTLAAKSSPGRLQCIITI